MPPARFGMCLLLWCAGCASGSPAPVPAPSPAVIVLDAKSGLPLAGASVTLMATGAGPEAGSEPGACFDAAHGIAGIGPVHASFQATTDARGRAFLAGSLPHDDSAHCAPGAPCAYRSLHHWVSVTRADYVEYLAPAWHSTIKLLGPEATIRSRSQAEELASRDPGIARVRQLLLAEQDPDPISSRGVPHICLTADGIWTVTVSGARLPHNEQVLSVPSVAAEIDAFTAAVRLTSCPDEGTELEILEASESRIRVRDLTTRLVYQCNGCSDERGPPSVCARPLEAGERLLRLDTPTELSRCVPRPEKPLEILLGEWRRSPSGSRFGQSHADLRGCLPSVNVGDATMPLEPYSPPSERGSTPLSVDPTSTPPAK